jgi:tetratricopeptide (TPR) repeat protein
MLAKAGKHDEAYVLATSLEDSIHRVKTLCILAIETQTQGNPVKAMQLLQEATEAAQKRSDARDQIEGLCIVARKMAEIGLEENARQLTNQAEGLINQIEVNRRSRTLRDLSETWAFLGNYKNARRSARKITDVYDRDQALIQVVVSVSKLGKFNQAVNLSLEIGDDYRRSDALFEVVMAYAQIGRFDQADRLIGRIPTESVRSQAYCILSKEKAKLGSYLEAQGYFEQANALVRSQTLNIEDRDEVYRFLAVILARHGHQAKALELTEKIETNEVKIKTLCDLAGLFSTISQPSGDAALQSVAVQCLTKARTNILQVEERWTRDDLLVYTIEAYAKIGLFDPVKGLLNQIESEHDKVLGLTTLAREHSLKQDTKSAEQTLREAEEITRALSDRLSKPLDLGVTLSALAAAYVLIDQPSKAQALFDQAQQDIRETEGQYYYHALNLGAYASELAHIGRFEEAIFEAKRIKEDVDAQAKSLLVIAKYAIQQGENEWAHEAIKEISDHRPWGPKHQGAAVLACGLAQVGHFTDAFKVLGSRWVDEYLMALMEWGEAFDKVEDGLSLGVVQSVLQVVGRQRDDYHKIVELLSA